MKKKEIVEKILETNTLLISKLNDIEKRVRVNEINIHTLFEETASPQGNGISITAPQLIKLAEGEDDA